MAFHHQGRALHFTDSGPAPGGGGAVVALHSGGLSSRQWARLSALLGPRHRVIAPDFFGVGGSSPWPEGEPFHFSVEAAAVAELLATLDGPAHLVGHSYGGLIALHAAMLAPRLVRSLCLFEPVTFGILYEAGGEDARAFERDMTFLRQEEVEGGGEIWLRRFVDWWQGQGAWDALPESMRAQFLSVGRKIWREVSSLLTDRTGRKEIGALNMPALVLRSERSPNAERRTCELLAAALPHGQLQDLSGAGHLAPVTHAGAVNQLIAAFVDAH